MFPQALTVYDTVPATGAATYAWALILIPLASAGLLLLLGRASDKWGHLLATLASWSTFVIGAAIAAQMWGAPEDARRFGETLFTWIPAGDLTVNFGLLVDPLSITFVILVTFVGSLIHVYAIAYMEHDEARRRFFAYLNFFIAAMLTLVLADSYAGLFAGWEGVGLASYLLIGFWNHVPAYAVAAKKAFVMNRVGDMGMLIAMMGMVASFQSVSFSEVSARAGSIPTASATFIGFFLLVLPAVSPLSSRCRRGSAMQWLARLPCPRLSTRQRWSPPVSISLFARVRSSRLRPLLRPRLLSSVQSHCSSARSSAVRRTT